MGLGLRLGLELVLRLGLSSEYFQQYCLMHTTARRQKELAMSLEREASLERSRVQLELDWQRRCEEAERTGYERQEELVRNLTQGKEEVNLFNILTFTTNPLCNMLFSFSGIISGEATETRA